ncbi:SMC family ATPase [Sphingorhabdus sp.]|uniref:SMC family ATPase n=1 Tax=Sphingorhabdus sp. TaxID=1902408 RepID=UPI00333FF451
MQLLRLEVKNWVHHRYRVCEFSRGLVAILGENGSGKSSLFGAIRWLLTGENPNYGVKSDNVSQYAKEGEASYATLEFEHNGHMAVVTRHLLPEKEQSILTIDGKEAGRGDKSVTAGVEKLLGVDSKFISRFIIVGQTDIFSFIDDNQTDTDKFFQRLFNTAKADKCQDVIGKALAKISIPEVLQTPGVLQAQLEQLHFDASKLAAQIAKLPTLDDFLASMQADQVTIRQWEEREKAGQELAKLAQQETAAQAQLDSAATAGKQYEDDLTALTDAANGQEEAYAAARTALGHWESYKHVAKLKEKLQEQRAQVAALRAKNPEPPQPAGETAEQVYRQMENTERQVKETEKFVKLFTAEGIAECPTCHTPTAKLTEQVREQHENLITLGGKFILLDASWMEKKAAEQAHTDWRKKEDELVGQERRLDDSERDLTTVAPPASTEDELQQTVGDYEQFQQVKQEIMPLAQQARETKAKLAGMLSGMRDRREQLEEGIKTAVVTQSDARLAQTNLQQRQQLLKTRNELSEQRTQLLFEMKRIEEQRDLAQQQEQTAARLRKWTGVAESARDALKNAPRLVAQRNLQRLESAINELLQIFSVNFLVKVATDGTPTFIAEFFDGRRQVAQRLSIGQKTVLALAFRVAVNAMFAEEIGLLALDEPTASLDQPRIQALAPVLEKLRDLSTAKGLQCLLVTHASNLSHLFESTIQLEAPEMRHGNNNR